MWYNCSIIWWVCLVDFQMRSCMSFQTVAWIVWEWLIVLRSTVAWAFPLLTISQIISFLIFSMFPLRYGRIIPNGFWVIGFQTILDDAAVSASSKWDPASFSNSGLNLLKGAGCRLYITIKNNTVCSAWKLQRTGIILVLYHLRSRDNKVVKRWKGECKFCRTSEREWLISFTEEHV